MSNSRHVMFIGFAKTGKSNLIRVLQGNPFSENPLPPTTLVGHYAVNIDYPVNICEMPHLTENMPKIVDSFAFQTHLPTDICAVIDISRDDESIHEQFAQLHYFYVFCGERNIFSKGIPQLSLVMSKCDLKDSRLSASEIAALKINFGNNIHIFHVSAKNENAELKDLRAYFITSFVDQFKKQRDIVAAHLEEYIIQYLPSAVLRMFDHKHNDRAIEIRKSILKNTKTLNEIDLILKNQKALFDGEEPVDVPVILVANKNHTTKLTNQPTHSLDSGYYNKIMECHDYIANIMNGEPESRIENRHRNKR
jgi:hypothetical protein